MNMKTRLIAILLIIASGISFASENKIPNCFNSNLSKKDREALGGGQVIIKSVDSLDELSIKSNTPAIEKALKAAKSIKPAYIAEIIHIIPYEGNENLLQKIDSIVIDIPSYKGIPYFSERSQQWFELYSEAIITSEKGDINSRDISADLTMEPFGVINTVISTKTTDSSYYYESTNTNKLMYYDKFTCVKPYKMKSLITATKQGDYWVLYGIGAVNAPEIFFLQNRIETSFMNRIKTFCQFIFQKL